MRDRERKMRRIAERVMKDKGEKDNEARKSETERETETQ